MTKPLTPKDYAALWAVLVFMIAVLVIAHLLVT